MKKLKKITAVLITVGALLITLAAMLQLFTSVGDLHSEFSTGAESFDNVREIVAVSGTLPIKLEQTEGETCEVSWNSGLPLIVSCDEYGTLRITEDDSFTMTLFSKKSAESGVTIRVPIKSYERIKLSSSSGDISCLNLSCESLDVYTRSGDIYVLGANERSKIKSDSGNIYLSINPFVGDMSVNGGAGDIEIDIAESFDLFVEFTTDSGGCLSSGFDVNTDNLRGDAALLSGKGGNTLKINTTSGNLIINK